MADLLSVKINTGELPSAAGVAEGYDLSRVIARWQSIANGQFRYDCRALKQMIRETDELRLWEKNVGGSRRKDRDDFLRHKVLIDYDLTEKDMAEIVALLRRDEPEKVCAKLRLRDGPGRPWDEEGNPDVVRIKDYGNKAEYLIARLRKADRDDLADAVERKDISARAAAIAAGIITPPTPLDTLRKTWAKASPEDRAAFLAEVT